MQIQGRPRLSRAFCSARDRNVPMLIRDEPGTAAPAASDETEFVACLDYGVRCTGWLCPFFPVPTLPPEELLEEAMQTERERKDRSVQEGRAILRKALREGRAWREEETRRRAIRRSRMADEGAAGTGRTVEPPRSP